MRRLFTCIASLLVTASVFAQSPDKMSYQAVVRDADNNLVVNQTVGMQISLLQESPEGNAVYVETQTPTTNANGLVNLEIGSGKLESGDFSKIDWGNGPYFIKTETDPKGGTEYSISGTSQLLSVPYALYAREAGNASDVSGIAINTQAIQDTATQIRADIPDVTGIATNTLAIQDTAAQIRADISDVTGISTNTQAIQDTATQIRADIPDVTGIATNTQAIQDTATQIRADIPDVAGIATNAQAIQDTATQIRADIPDVTGIGTNTQAIQDTAAQIRADIPNISESDPSVPIGTQVGEMQYWDGTHWITVAAGSEGQVLMFVNGVPAWKAHIENWEVENPVTGKMWMDRNMGASRAATSITDTYAHGDLYQWGRAADGHQIRTSGTTTTLSNSDTPGHSNFIINDTDPGDWRNPQNDNLWQGVSSMNNPCLTGYRVPTRAEWEAEIQSWSSNDAYGAFNSPLKLLQAGIRDNLNGLILTSDYGGNYWSSTVFNSQAVGIYFDPTYASALNTDRAVGYSVRCIADDNPLPETITNPVTGKTWMNHNLGASQVATSSIDADAYGDLYQWGRAADGHQIRTSGTTASLSSNDTPLHGNFIITAVNPNDWRSPQNDALWQGVNGNNNPCPEGFRVPTDPEWDAERLSWNSNDAIGAFASPLKLPQAGYRHSVTGILDVVGNHGYYWSSTVANTNSRGLSFNNGAIISTYQRGHGLSVRCVED